MTQEELLALEIAALRGHAAKLSLMLDIAITALREANDLIANDYIAHKVSDAQGVRLQKLEATCEALGVEP